MSKHIKISLFDNNQHIEIVNDAIVKINHNNTDVIIRLSNISSMGYTETKYIHKTQLYCYIILIIQTIFVLYNAYCYSFIESYWYVFVSSVLLFITLMFIWDYEHNSFLKLIVNELVIKTHDDNTYIVRHFVNIENSIYKDESYPYRKKVDYYKTEKTLFDLKEAIIQCKSKTII